MLEGDDRAAEKALTVMALIAAEVFIIRHDQRPRIPKDRLVLANHCDRIDDGDRFPNPVIVTINIIE